MIGIFRPSAETRSIRQPAPRTLGLLLRSLQALLPPDPFHSCGVRTPALLVPQPREAPIPIAPILPGKGNDSIPPGFFISRLSRPILLRGATWPHYPACPAFGHREPRLRMADGFSASGWA